MRGNLSETAAPLEISAMKALLKSIPVAAALLALAACGTQQDSSIASLNSGAPSSSNAPDNRSVPSDPHQKLLAFAKCMRSNGVDMPDPDPNATGMSMPAIKAGDADKAGKAMEACKKFAPDNIANPDDPAVKAKRAEFAKCMRDHGVDMPDPGSGGSISIDGSDGKFQAAMKACQK